MNQQPIHPPIPFGASSYVALTGLSGAIAAFVLAFWQNHWVLNGDIVALAVTAGSVLIAWVAARSHQAAKLIETAKKDLQDVGIQVSATPGAEAVVTTPPAPTT